MPGIDFVQDPNDQNSSSKGSTTGSGIEYTNPDVDQPAVVSKSAKKGWFSGLFSKPATPKLGKAKAVTPPNTGADLDMNAQFADKLNSKHNAAKPVVAQESVQPPSAPQIAKHTVKPNMTKPAKMAPAMPTAPAISNDTPVVSAAPITPMPTPVPTPASAPAPMAKSAPQPPIIAPVVKPAAVHLPPAPPPPVAPMPAVIMTNPSVPAQAAAPITPAAPSGMAVPHAQIDPEGTMHVKNVAEVSGKLTQPIDLEDAPFTINLLPHFSKQEKKVASPATGLIHTVTITLVVLSLVYAGMLSYRTYTIYKTRTVVDQIASLEQDIQGYAPLQAEINGTNATLSSVANIIGKHVYWSNAFIILERYTLPNVQYLAVSGNTSGLLTLQAVTTDYNSVSQQSTVFDEAKDVFSNVTVTSASEIGTSNAEDGAGNSTTKDKAINFSITLTLQPDVLQYQRDLPQP